MKRDGMGTHANVKEATDRYVVPALQRGLQLLGEFKRNDRELTGAELSRRMDLPRASVFRLLQTLEQMGFVERVGDSANYKLGIAVLRLGFEFLASMELTEHGRPVLSGPVAYGLNGQVAGTVTSDCQSICETDIECTGRMAYNQMMHLERNTDANNTHH